MAWMMDLPMSALFLKVNWQEERLQWKWVVRWPVESTNCNCVQIWMDIVHCSTKMRRVLMRLVDEERQGMDEKELKRVASSEE